MRYLIDEAPYPAPKVHTRLRINKNINFHRNEVHSFAFLELEQRCNWILEEHDKELHWYSNNEGDSRTNCRVTRPYVNVAQLPCRTPINDHQRCDYKTWQKHIKHLWRRLFQLDYFCHFIHGRWEGSTKLEKLNLCWSRSEQDFFKFQLNCSTIDPLRSRLGV